MAEKSLDTGLVLQTAASIRSDLQTYYYDAVGSNKRVHTGDEDLVLLPKENLSRSCIEWMVDRIETSNRSSFIQRLYVSRLASMNQHFNIGGIITTICRGLLPCVRQSGIGYYYRYFILDFNLQVVSKLSGSGQFIEIDCSTGQVRNWDDFLAKFLIPLLPSSAVAIVDTLGVVHQLSPNPRRAEVRVINFKVPGAIPVNPGVFDADDIINGIPNRTLLLSAFEEHIQKVSLIVSDPIAGSNEFKADLQFYVGAALAGGFRSRFSRPNGQSGFDDGSEFGFDTTAAAVETDTGLVVALLGLRAFTAGNNTKIHYIEPAWWIKGFFNHRAHLIVRYGMFKRLYADVLTGLSSSTGNELQDYICNSEVEKYGGARINACTEISKRLPTTLNLLKHSHTGAKYVVMSIEVPKSFDQIVELYSLFNLLSWFDNRSIISLQAARGGLLNRRHNHAFIYNAFMIDAGTGVGQLPLIRMLNPVMNVDVLYAATVQAPLTLTVDAGEFTSRLHGMPLLVRRTDTINGRLALFGALAYIVRGESVPMDSLLLGQKKKVAQTGKKEKMGEKSVPETTTHKEVPPPSTSPVVV